MTNDDQKIKKQQQRRREFKFVPRTINPVKIVNAFIFSANKQVRESRLVLQENRPWTKVKLFSDPVSISNHQADGASVFIFDDTALPFVDVQKIKQNNADAVIILLSSNEQIHCSPPSVARERYPYTTKADLIFGIDNSEFTPDAIITSVVRCAEDKINIEKYSTVRRYIFLIVDDEPRWFSQFLPVLYNIIGQRADIALTRTYEETIHFLFGVTDESEIDEQNFASSGHGDDVVCVITDMFFPKGDNLKYEAGRDLFHLLNKYYPRIPIIIASKAKEGHDLKHLAFIMPKGDSGSLQSLHKYIHDHTGLGDFFIRSSSGKIYECIKDIHGMYRMLLDAEKDTASGAELRELLEYYGRKDYFSTWLYMHGFREIADQLRPRQDKGKRLVTVLKRHLQRQILRMERTPLIINGKKIYNLSDLLDVLRTVAPEKIQKFSDNDYFSTWLDRKGYSDLAEKFRPIHGSGPRLVQALESCVEKWISTNGQRLME